MCEYCGAKPEGMLCRGPHLGGEKYQMLNLIDEFTHECLAIRIDSGSSPPT